MRHVSGLPVMLVVSAMLLTARLGEGAEPTNAVGTACGAYLGKAHTAAEDRSGPTVMLSYGKETLGKNPISSFMYFVPLISLTLVDRQTSADNDVEVGIISYDRQIGAKSFYVACEFEIWGKGFHKYIFDPAEMIAALTNELETDDSLTHALDYIKFEGEGFGIIKIEGTISGSTRTVTQVNLKFNGRGWKSPVTIGLYDIKPKDGQYRYENRSNELVARVNTLAFKKSDGIPRMWVRVASITKAAAPDGPFAFVKGAIANLFIEPPKIDRLGNKTMLNFGYAILNQRPEFTFPKASKITEDRTVAVSTPER